MEVRSWLSTCSSAPRGGSTYNDCTNPSPKPNALPEKLLISDTSSSSLSTSQNTIHSSSLQTNLSLQTHPSVPSLQKLSPETLNLSITHLCLHSLKPNPTAHVNFLAFHHHLLYAATANQVHVFDTSNNNNYKLIDTFFTNASTGFVKSITFCNKKVLTAYQDSKIRVWTYKENDNKFKHVLIATLPTLEDRLKRFILPQNYVQVRRHKKRLWIQHNDAVSGLAILENCIFSVSWDKYLKMWRTSDLRCIESVKAHDDAVNAVVVSADGKIYTGSADRRIKVWARQEKRHVLIATLEKHKSAVNALALSSDGSVLFSGANDRSILVWGREDSANYMVVVGALRGHGKAILCLMINGCDLLFSGSADRTVRIWQRGHDGKYCCLTVLDGHDKPVKSLASVSESSGAIKVYSGSFDGEIKVWQIMVSSPMALSSQIFRNKNS